jgi:hypothetical protein
MKALPSTLILSLSALASVQGAVIFRELETQPPGQRRPPLMLDFDDDGETDFGIRFRIAGGLERLEVLISDNTAFVYQPDLNLFIGVRGAALDEGFTVDSLEGRPLFAYQENDFPEGVVLGNYIIATYNSFAQTGEGDFNDRRAYLGFRFNGDDGPQYGYVELDGRSSADFTVYSYAYQTEPNVPILTGQIPEPSAPLLLVGSSVFLIRRRSRSAH